MSRSLDIAISDITTTDRLRGLDGDWATLLAESIKGTGAELDVQVDNVDRRIAQAITKASKGFVKTMMCYRAWMSDDLETPSMMPRSFVLSECSADSMTVTAKARVAIDLAGAFPRRLFTATEYPGLLGL